MHCQVFRYYFECKTILGSTLQPKTFHFELIFSLSIGGGVDRLEPISLIIENNYWQVTSGTSWFINIVRVSRYSGAAMKPRNHAHVIMRSEWCHCLEVVPERWRRHGRRPWPQQRRWYLNNCSSTKYSSILECGIKDSSALDGLARMAEVDEIVYQTRIWQ